MIFWNIFFALELALALYVIWTSTPAVFVGSVEPWR